MMEQYIKTASGMLKSLDDDNDAMTNIKRYLSMDETEWKHIFEQNCEMRNSSFGNYVYIRASLEIGNVCSNTCKYCGMSLFNTKLNRYQMTNEEIIKVIDQVSMSGIKQLHIVSGEIESNKVKQICDCIRYAKNVGLNVTLVLGKQSMETYQLLLNSGASRYIMKFETSNEQLYEDTKNGDKLTDRLGNILYLQDIGYKVGTGTIIGLPGTALSDVCRDIMLLKKINPHMASCSIFSPNQESEYKNHPAGSSELALKFITLMRRYLRPDIYITSSSSLGSEGQIRALKAGANVISVHFTPSKYAECFSMYKATERVKRQLDEAHQMIKCANLKVGEYV